MYCNVSEDIIYYIFLYFYTAPFNFVYHLLFLSPLESGVRSQPLLTLLLSRWITFIRVAAAGNFLYLSYHHHQGSYWWQNYPSFSVEEAEETVQSLPTPIYIISFRFSVSVFLEYVTLLMCSILQEELLKAIGTVVSSCSKQLKEGAHEQPTIDDIIQAVLKECRKENVKYKIVALKCAADTSLETVGAQSPKEEDDPDEKAKELQTEFLLCAFSTLGKAWPRNPATQCKALFCIPAALHIWESKQFGV
ncbi:hypothetical protein AB205_0202450 [Aquarana catesbeiana]|uniref:Uncharacterized protein n=1 Tax=Aquarana catesbeiana TaxID=8400 RepID=A0A2G9RSP5_AQUCT|nr:hypothetical protein AB205_0202450 [Aquarana catesbeiana]